LIFHLIPAQSLFSDIGQLSNSLANKLGRGAIVKAAQSRIDIGDIKTLAAAIAAILDIFYVISIISNRTHRLTSS